MDNQKKIISLQQQIYALRTEREIDLTLLLNYTKLAIHCQNAAIREQILHTLQEKLSAMLSEKVSQA